MWIKGLNYALVSRRPRAEGNLRLVKFMFPSRGEQAKRAVVEEKEEEEEAHRREIPKTFTFYPSAPVELKRKRSIILLSSHHETAQRGL